MLTEILAKEVEQNFDTSRVEVDIIFDDSSLYGAMDFSRIEWAATQALKETNGSKHAKIYIRDNTQSFVYDYDVEDDRLTRKEEDPGEYHLPLRKRDEWLKEEPGKSIKREANGNLLKTFLLFTIPIAIYAGLYYGTVAGSEIAMYAMHMGEIGELLLILNILAKKIKLGRYGL